MNPDSLRERCIRSDHGFRCCIVARPDACEECWRVYYGDIHAGTLAIRSGNPFMISVGIYGGSGFMALEASPQGIEAFEASFEFGGIASIGYGPLQGTAYVTTGAYVRKDQLGCTFAALLSAGFTAHIACFGISAAFTLRLYKRAGDSSVSGEAQLTFTFSIGRYIKVSYTIRVARSMQAGFGGGGKEAAFNTLPGSGVQVAALGSFALPGRAVRYLADMQPEP